MSTGYYLKRPACECCGRSYEPLHVASYPSGFHGYTELYPVPPESGFLAETLVSRADWGRFVEKEIRCYGSVLQDEYGHDVAFEDVLPDPAVTLPQWKYNLVYWERNSQDSSFLGMGVGDFTWQSDGYTFTVGAWT